MSGVRVGFIGAGKMATALARGIVSQGKILQNSSHLMASCPVQDSQLLEPIRELGGITTNDNLYVVDNSDVVIMAVKPLIMEKVLQEIKPAVFDTSKLVVSIAAGIKIQQIQQNLHSESKVFRVMPNTPSLVQEGATVFSKCQNCSSRDSNVIKEILSAVGPTCFEVPENMIDAVTGISGSGPAYMYIIIEAMADAGVKMGLPRDLAYKLAAQTMVGSGQMVLKTGIHPAVLKDEVCSPGGSTITAVDQLEKSGIRSSMMKAVEAATIRCQQLGS